MRCKLTLSKLVVALSSLGLMWCSTTAAHGLPPTSLGPPAPRTALHCTRDRWGCSTPQEKAAVKRALRKEFGSGYEGRKAICISYAESGHNPYAANRRDHYGGSYGAMQINASHRSWVDFSRIYDPTYNARVAHRLYRSGGWRHWTTAYKC